MTKIFNLDHLDLYELTEILLSVKYQFGLATESEAMENIESGEYSKEDILNAVAYYRTKGLAPREVRMNFLPTSLEEVIEDYKTILL